MIQIKIVSAFLKPEFYDHAVESIELIETHISWVFLTGQFAYKIKKPVDFGFLDFTRLAQRKYYCEQELILNRRFAPEIYLDVIPVTEFENTLALDGAGVIVDYAIKMKQFDQKCLLDQMLKNKQVTLQNIDDLSDTVSNFHNNINIAESASKYGSVAEVLKPVEHNFSILGSLLGNKGDLKTLDSLNKKMQQMYDTIKPHLKQRKEDGHIRECHGDLHLGNIALIKQKILLFDGIEFNDSFRWIDTMSEIAFLIMDLQDHDQTVFANHFLNRYLSTTGDYSGLPVLKFYQLYRATVRAKVAGLRLEQQTQNSNAYKHTIKELTKYLDLARSYTENSRPFLAITYGISGSGKSWLALRLADQTGAIQLRSDAERKRLYPSTEKDLYSKIVTQQTYNHLINLCKLLLNAQYSVIVDATFLDKKWRKLFHEIAAQHKTPYHILYCHVDQTTLKTRLDNRKNEIDNISDADIDVMTSQIKNIDQLDSEEQKYTISINTAELDECSSIISQINRH